MNKKTILLLSLFIIILACNKNDDLSQTIETSRLEINTTTDHTVKEVVEKSIEAKKQPAETKTQELPWHQCATLKKEEFIQSCPGLESASSKYNEELKLCEIRMGTSKTISSSGVGINIEETSIEDARETFSRRTKVIEDNQTIKNIKKSYGNNVFSYEKLISSGSQDGTTSGTWRQIIDILKGRKVAKIQTIPVNACQNINDLAKKLFTRI